MGRGRNFNKRVETLLLKPQGYYKEMQQTRNTTQPGTVVTIYADRAVWGIFLSRPPRLSGADRIHTCGKTNLWRPNTVTRIEYHFCVPNTVTRLSARRTCGAPGQLVQMKLHSELQADAEMPQRASPGPPAQKRRSLEIAKVGLRIQNSPKSPMFVSRDPYLFVKPKTERETL